MKNKKHWSLKRLESVNGWGFVFIAIIIIALISFIPMIQSFLLSFQAGKGVIMEFNGIGNYKRLFVDAMFIQSLKNTITYLVIQVPVMIILALVISTMLNERDLKFRGVFRTAIFLPCVTSLVAYSVLFKSMFSTDGLINRVLFRLSLIQEPIPWLLDPFWAKVTIILAITWRWTGYNMIFYLAGLQNIDSSIYEAADIDGASDGAKFFKITVPMLKPIILMTTIMSTNGTLQLFDEVVNLTGGGPSNSTMTISQYIYNLLFKFTPNFGYASTVSYAIVIIVGVLSFVQFKVGGDKNV